MSTVVLLARVVLGAVFLTAGVGKLLDLEGSRSAIRGFGVPEGAAKLAGLLLPLAELATAVALVFRPSAQWGAVAALVLLLTFMAGIGNALRKGQAPDCNCFGQIHSAPVGRGTLVRNGVLAVIAAIAVIKGPGPAIDAWVRARSAGELVAVAAAAVAIALAIAWWQQRESVGRLQDELAKARKAESMLPPGLPVGTPAPDFALTSLDGETVTLAHLHDKRPALLVFMSPGCGSCQELFPNMRRWQQTLQERLAIAIISGGGAELNAVLRDEYGLSTVLLQEDKETIESYRIRATPTAVLITQEGKIGSAPAESVFGIEPLVRLVLRGGDVPAITEGTAV